MDYYEIKINYRSSLPADVVGDVLANELAEIGFESFTQEGYVLTGYIGETLYKREILENQLSYFPFTDITFAVEENLIISQDWNEEWEKNYFKPIRIGKDCIIRASFHPEEEGYRYPIIIDPKMAFGTGNHETTYLMINEILKVDLTGKEVLDMGCGTAVLAILASMKGAKRVVAIDIDEWAYGNAQENVRLNNIDNIDISLGGAELISSFSSFDFIFANINRNILLADMAEYAGHLKSGGYLYMSGFYKEDIPVVEEEAIRQGLSLEYVEERNNWVVVKTRI